MIITMSSVYTIQVLPPGSNKYRPGPRKSTTVCCLLIPNHLLYDWNYEKRQNDRSFISQLNSSTFHTIDGSSNFAHQYKEDSSLASRLYSKARALSSKLMKLKRRSQEKMLKGNYCVDVYEEDVTMKDQIIDSLQKEILSLR